MTKDQIKKLSTHRLLNIFRMVRSDLWGRDPERPYDECDFEQENFYNLLKEELNKREHVPRKKDKKKK